MKYLQAYIDGQRGPWSKTIPYKVRGEIIELSKASRRIRRIAHSTARTLRRINKLLARQLARRNNLDLRQQVKTLKAAKQTRHQYVRTMNQIGEIAIPGPYSDIRNAAGVVTSRKVAYPADMVYVYPGIKKTIVGYRPTDVNLVPRRNPVQISSFWQNALSTSGYLKPAIKSRPIIYLPKSKWSLRGTQYSGIDGGTPQPLSFNMSYADQALQKALAKVYESDLQASEYLIEWRQVARLLKDPFRTVLSFHKVLERWTARDAWIWIPQRRYRKFGNGALSSKAPHGGVLMSMRTKRELSPVGVSSKILNEACNRWLQYRYGIAPIMSDMVTIMDLWMRPVTIPHLRSKSARYWVSRPAKAYSQHMEQLSNLHFTYKREKVSGEFYSAKVWYKQLEEPPVSYKYGLHPSQWLNVIWNAVPYSFVADWVINMDQWMTSQRDVPWIQLYGNVVTRKVFSKMRSTCVRVAETTYGEALVISGSPIATVGTEQICRLCDLPRSLGPFWSNAWQSVKNLMTAATLTLAPITGSSSSKTTKTRKG